MNIIVLFPSPVGEVVSYIDVNKLGVIISTNMFPSPIGEVVSYI